jgi:hypothetical protein
MVPRASSKDRTQRLVSKRGAVKRMPSSLARIARSLSGSDARPTAFATYLPRGIERGSQGGRGGSEIESGREGGGGSESGKEGGGERSS